MRITAEGARAYFQHPTQRSGAMVDPADLHDDGLFYYAHDGVCLVFHRSMWPGVWMVHVGVMPAAWGKTKGPILRMLAEFQRQERPELITAWMKAENRAVAALARRCGFALAGGMDLPSGRVDFYEWRLECL